MGSDSSLAAQSSEKVRLGFQGSVAVIRIDNPPVNAGSHAVRAGIAAALSEAQVQGATGAVLIGEGKSFIAGSDLKEFGQKLNPPELPDVIRACEEAPFPVVAALHGVALGGGLELALGCDYRVVAKGTKVGLPEVSLGMVPGAGGTQRLPRLVGRSRAIAMICGSERIDAAEAAAIGLVDLVAEGDLLQAAVGFVAGKGKRVAQSLTVPSEPDDAIREAAAKALKRGRNRPNVAEAIRLVEASADADVDGVLGDERATFQRLRVSDDAFALRHLFFAERKAGQVDGLDMSLARDVRSVAVIGGGTMGQGIARAFLNAGLTVTLAERDEAALATALTRLKDSIEASVAKGRLASADDQFRRLSGTANLSTLSCDLAIEAVFEDMDAKRAVLTSLAAALGPEAIIATNTSYLDIDVMAEGIAHPERILGLHFFSPADLMALLEVVRAKRTSDEALATAMKLARRLGKQPVLARVAEGFIGNRIYAAYRRRAELLVLDGTAPEAVDAAMRSFGLAMGPFEVSDMSGLDIAWAMRKRQAATRDPQARYVAIPDRLCEAGRLGRKTGSGWYDYTTRKAQPDPEVSRIIAAEQAAAGITPVACDAETIQRQLLAAIVNEAACLLDEGIAQRASDVDVTLANGYGFPRWTGGPLYWAAKQPEEAIAADLERLERAIGHGFKRGPVEQVLKSVL